MKKYILILAILMVAISSQAFANVVFNSLNGHFYEAIAGKYDWDVAKTEAEGKVYNGANGYLATLTSQAENDWVWANVLAVAAPSWYWLGGFQSPNGPEPAGGWQWVTGEAWSFTSWNNGEPNNNGNNNPEEDALQFWDNSKWNDVSADSDNAVYGGTTYYRGYIVEYAPVPEPGTMMLLGTGLLGMIGYGKVKLGKR